MTTDQPLPEQLVTTTLVWHPERGASIQEGQPFPVDAKNSEMVAVARKYIQKGYLRDAFEAAPTRHGPTALTSNFLGRGKLVAAGYETFESLRGKTAADLSTVEGLTEGQPERIVALVAAHFGE
ncbi:hypothetical protein [Deinococcus soli (ex Cha et al. 2016)]|uniref:Uncharacterized protein n=1 Tax=Deinococcus soli (ex Cha et al. 2016) TaxID=1309411 RepID=A0ACC6KLP8_9DEIO|nr:hypothetical protein [Deinococcus soli (ex Cha et al. 2016)]MDR6753426.1 hypothetical protein [Deinococcus soli (ex Cha et al. 2016)]